MNRMPAPVPGVRERRVVDPPAVVEIELPRGDVTEGVVRIGTTVRRPHQPQSFAVAAYLDHLEVAGFDGAPRFLGRDDRGRDVLTFLEGRVAGDPVEAWAHGDELLTSVARLVRRLHDASAGYDDAAEPFPARDLPEPEHELIAHLDVTPQNVVTRDGLAVGVVDFDLAGWTTRRGDAWNTVMHWAPMRADADLREWTGVDRLGRLRLFADAYGWSDRERIGLAEFGAARADLSRERMRRRAERDGGGWARMWRDGVGDLIARRADWLRANADEIEDALRT